MSPAFSSLDELGDGYGFRKIRAPLGVSAFGVNALVYPPGYDGFLHYHDTQDELYFVHRGKVLVEVDGETRELGEGGLDVIGGICLRDSREPKAVGQPLEQRKSETRFQEPHHTADRRLRDVQLLARSHEAAMARRGLEGAQTVQRRQSAHGID